MRLRVIQNSSPENVVISLCGKWLAITRNDPQWSVAIQHLSRLRYLTSLLRGQRNHLIGKRLIVQSFGPKTSNPHGTNLTIPKTIAILEMNEWSFLWTKSILDIRACVKLACCKLSNIQKPIRQNFCTKYRKEIAPPGRRNRKNNWPRIWFLRERENFRKRPK
jgi:hypothetical protein